MSNTHNGVSNEPDVQVKNSSWNKDFPAIANAPGEKKSQEFDDNKYASMSCCVLDYHLEKIAKMLNLNVEDLSVFERASSFRHHMHTDDRDRIIKKEGIGDLPFIFYDKSSGNNSKVEWKGFGICVYEILGDYKSEKIKYATIKFPTAGGGEDDFIILPKKETRNLILYFNRMKIKSYKAVVPILHEEMLHDVMKNTVNFIISGKKIKKYGASAQRGVILNGEPGNGKTMTCRYIKAMANIHGIDVRNISSGELEGAYTRGELEYVFNQTGFLFFDDIDISFFDRKGDGRMACALLSALDGMQSKENCVRIFTTNEKISDMDPAFKRPGRIDKIITFEKPNGNMRKRLFDTWPEEIRKSIDNESFIEETNNFSFAECEAIRNIMVVNHVIEEEDWDFNKALIEYHDRAGDSFENKNNMGFGK